MNNEKYRTILKAQLNTEPTKSEDELEQLLSNDGQIVEGERNAKLFSIACAMRAAGHDWSRPSKRVQYLLL